MGEDMGEDQGQPKRRRRGAELEDAILRAAADELREVGYDAMTFDSVATRAETSRAVIYRRWPGKAELVAAAFENRMRNVEVVAPDTGSLEGDVRGLLEC
jgi:AcrR family transcriptional regulator